MDPKRSQNRRFLVLAGVILALVPVGFFAFLHEPPPPPVVEVATPPAPLVEPVETAPEPPRVEELKLGETTGEVEVRRGAGDYEKAVLGMVLRKDDALRTGDGRAKLSADGSYEIDVEPFTSLEVGELTASLSRLLLENGMLTADVKAKDGRVVEVAAKNSDAVARTSDGAFALSSNGEGTVAVGARRGEVEFAAAGKAVLLRAGQTSVALPSSQPTDPVQVPTSLFLKVALPSDGEINQNRLTVKGTTSPGAHLIVAGRRVTVSADGRFSTVVKLREGKNALLVEGRDVAGNQVAKRADLVVDTTAPDSRIPTEDLWKKR